MEGEREERDLRGGETDDYRLATFARSAQIRRQVFSRNFRTKGTIVPNIVYDALINPVKGSNCLTVPRKYSQKCQIK